jgi:CrcB protein
MTLANLFIVALGGAIGSVCRYMVSVGAGRYLGLDFPWGTMIVNIAGSFLMGIFIELLALKLHASHSVRLFVAVGFLGGFTTLSSFSLDTVVLWERGAVFAAAAYALGSIILSVAGLVAGLAVVRTLL